MGIVAAQCLVFIAQNDICAPRPLYYHLFFLDNRRDPARSPPRRLPDSLLFPSISQPFHAPSRLVSPFDPLFEPLGTPFRCCFRPPLAFRHYISSVSCVVPSRFLYVFRHVSGVPAVGIGAGGAFRVVSYRAFHAVAPLPVSFSCALDETCRLPRRGAGREAGRFMEGFM